MKTYSVLTPFGTVVVLANHFFLDWEAKKDIIVFMQDDNDTPVAMFTDWSYVIEAQIDKVD